MKKYIGEIGLFLVAIIWGGGFVATRAALDGGLTTSQIMTLRFFLSALVMNIIFFKPIKENFTPGLIKSGIILGICLFAGFFLQTMGLNYTTPSKNAFLTSVNVVIVPFIGVVLYKRKIDKFGIISSFMAIIGIAILSLSADFSVNKGDILTLLCAFGFAFQIFFTSEFVKNQNPMALTAMQFTVAFVLSFIVQIFMGEVRLESTIGGYMGIVYLALFSTALCFLLQTICSKMVDGTRVAIILSTEAVFGTIFSIIILSEPITARMIIGSIIIFASVITAETKLSFLRKKA
ncbi:DMT family transporter [Peptacetobacter hominis]|uniref:DMT family transporter n=1 Tax=Peptacetobacter hominis TaxID=2743610 RepID=A0A544QWB4_9FIRM|nr:DMT family transporter [Peptacetobacter hominis]TQQ84987.1 DMT family transporter [Peptacetobacter hominis]